MKMLAQFSL